MTIIKNRDDLLDYIISQSQSGQRDWFGFPQQKIAGIYIAYEIAKLHADKLSPDEVADYVSKLNNAIFEKLVLSPKIKNS
jgi:hypothetical protein